MKIPAGLALVFDMDGVILDSNPTHREAWRLYNWRFGIENLQSGQGIRPFGIPASEWRKILNSKLNALSALAV